MKVALVGLSPKSVKPFEDCPSGTRLAVWMNYLNLNWHALGKFNLASKQLEKDRPLRKADIDLNQADLNEFDIVLCIGKQAYKWFEPKDHQTAFYLPHPSGRNRMNNDRGEIYGYLNNVRFHLEDIKEKL